MVGQRNGRIRGPGRVATGEVGFFGMRIPAAQVFQDAADDGGLVDDGDHPQGTAALGTFQRVYFVDFADEPGLVGAGGAVERGFIEVQGGGVGLRVG